MSKASFMEQGARAARNINARSPGNEYRMPVYGEGKSWQAKAFAEGFRQEVAVIKRREMKSKMLASLNPGVSKIRCENKEQAYSRKMCGMISGGVLTTVVPTGQSIWLHFKNERGERGLLELDDVELVPFDFAAARRQVYEAYRSPDSLPMSRMGYDYRYDVKLETEHYTVEVDTAAGYGYFEHKTLGDERGGGLWFDEKYGKLMLTDYDGTADLPKQVREALRAHPMIFVGEEFN